VNWEIHFTLGNPSGFLRESKFDQLIMFAESQPLRPILLNTVIQLKEPCEIEIGEMEQFSHTADVGVIARGKNVEHLFALCCRGLVEVITGRKPERVLRTAEKCGLVPKRISVNVKGQDIESLLVTFLTEVLYLLETEDLLVYSSSVSIAGDGLELTANFECVEYDMGKLGYITEVKAVTYHMISVEECAGGGWGARVIFDL